MSLFVPVFEALNVVHARYIVVDRLATVLHGYARFTADIDLMIDLQPDEARKTMSALVRHGMIPRAPVEPREFAEPHIRRQWIEEKNMRVFSLWKPDEPLVSVDLFVENPLDFDVVLSRSERIPLGPIDVLIASIPDLIELKKLAGRPQDLIDIEKLGKILALKRKADDE